MRCMSWPLAILPAKTVTTNQDLPSQPPNIIRVSVNSSYAISIYWSAPPTDSHNGIILGYTLELIEQHNSKEVTQVNVSASIFYYQFNGLEENTDYTILIRAWNSIGYSPYSVHNVSTIQSTIEYNLTAVSSTNSITLQWSVPPLYQQNIQITRYEITQFTLATSLDSTHIISNVSASELQYTVNELEEDVVYHFRVRVYTVLGPGLYSPEIIVKTNQAIPSNSPTNLQLTVLSTTQIEVEWGSVPIIDQNGPIIGYLISASTSTAEQTFYPTTQSNYILDSLQPYTEYSIKIRAINSVGPGPYTPSITTTTKPAVPSGAPTQLSILLITHNAVNISWSEVSSSSINGLLEYYSVQINVTQTTTSFLHTSNFSHTFITNLTPYTQYLLAVAAVNTLGRGPYSSILHFTTGQSSPTQSPELVSVQLLTPYSVYVVETHPN